MNCPKCIIYWKTCFSICLLRSVQNLPRWKIKDILQCLRRLFLSYPISSLSFLAEFTVSTEHKTDNIHYDKFMPNNVCFSLVFLRLRAAHQSLGEEFWSRLIGPRSLAREGRNERYCRFLFYVICHPLHHPKTRMCWWWRRAAIPHTATQLIGREHLNETLVFLGIDCRPETISLHINNCVCFHSYQ